jgi:hypothetical protein
VAREAVEREREHDARGARRPAPLAFHRFEPLEKTADVEQETGKLRPDGLKGAGHSLLGGHDKIGKSGRSVAAAAAAALRNRRDPVRGHARRQPARVKSARRRSPAASCSKEIKGRPSGPLRRASQASGLSASFV